MTKLEARMTNGEAPHPIPLLGEERGREATVRRGVLRTCLQGLAGSAGEM